MRLFPFSVSLILLSCLAAPAFAGSSFQDALQSESKTPPIQKIQKMQEIRGDKAPGSAAAMTPKSEFRTDRARGENSRTVAEVFAQAKELNGKTVRVRGKIMKISRMIMGRNWVHLQDGTGAEGQHDLVATTTEDAMVDAVVTVRGVVAADRDFGAGYRYAAILEQAHIEADKNENAGAGRK